MRTFILVFSFLFLVFGSNVEAQRKSKSGSYGKNYSSKSYSVKSGYVQRPLYVKPSPNKSVSVKGYYNKNGKWVEPYKRTSPNKTVRDNWDTRPNVNPYTGKPGSKDPNRTKQ